MAFDYSKNVKGKDEKAQALKIQQQAVAKSKTTAPAQKKEAPKPDLVKTFDLKTFFSKEQTEARKQENAKSFYGEKVAEEVKKSSESLQRNIPSKLDAFIYAPLKSSGLNLVNQLLPKDVIKKGETSLKAYPTVATLGTVAGYASPSSAGVKITKPFVDKVVKSTGSKLAGSVLEGALVGAGTTATENVVPVATGQKSVGQAAKEVGTGLVLGAGLDVGLYGLGKVAKPLLDKIKLGKALTQAEKAEVAKSANVDVSKVDDLIKKAVEPKASKLQQIAKELEQPQISAKAGKIVETSKLQREKGLEGALRELGPLPVKVERQKALDSALKQIELDSKVKQELPSMNKPTVETTQPRTELVKPLVDTNVNKGLTTHKIDLNEPKPQVENRFNPQVETPEGMKLSKFNKTAANSPVTGDELLKRINEDPLTYKADNRQNQIETAKKVVNEDFEAAAQMVRVGDRFRNDAENEIAKAVFEELQKQGRFDESFEVLEAIKRKGSKGGQDIETFKTWAKSTPEGMQRWAYNTLEQGEVKPDVIKQITKEVGEDMRKLQAETDPKELSKLVSKKIKNKKERDVFLKLIADEDSLENVKALGVAKIQADVMSKIAQSTGRKLSTFQAMSHLLNFRTFEGNILGNAASIGLEGVANLPANAFDSVLSLRTGRKTISSGVPRWKEGFSLGKVQGKRATLESLLGVNRVQNNKYDLLMGRTFEGVPVLEQGEKLLSLSLNVPDEFFKGFAKANSLYDQVRARIGKEANNMTFSQILDKATQAEIDTAIEEAGFATFQNDSLPATFLTKAKDLLNIIGLGKNSKTGIREFGLGDLVIKYTRVPGNIIARGIEYSPVGAMKGLYALVNVPKTRELQRKAAQTFGRGFTGSTAIATGYMLNKLGILSADKENSGPRELAMNRAEGVSGNKINTSALLRLITGGDPKAKDGDTYKDFTWLQPLSIAMSVGANLAENDKNPFTLDSTSKTFEEVLDLPTLYTIKSMLYESQKEGASAEDVLSVPVLEAIPGFVPSIIRQTAQTIDPVVRNTKGADLRETAILKTKANIPFLSKTIEPKVSPTGEEIKRVGGAYATMFDRAATSEYKPIAYSDKLKAIKELSGETKQFLPTVAPNTITIGKEKITLTPAEKTKYMKLVGTYLDEQYTKVLQNVNTSDLNPAKAKNLSDRLSKLQEQAREKAKLEIKKGR